MCVDRIYKGEQLVLENELPQKPEQFLRRLQVLGHKLDALRVRKRLASYVSVLVDRLCNLTGLPVSAIEDNPSESMEVINVTKEVPSSQVLANKKASLVKRLSRGPIGVTSPATGRLLNHTVLRRQAGIPIAIPQSESVAQDTMLSAVLGRSSGA